MRKLTAPLKARGLIAEEELPGAELQSDEALREYVEYQAWGHHASCTCAIGTDGDPLAVLDGDFRVRGTENVRVVDASIFHASPGSSSSARFIWPPRRPPMCCSPADSRTAPMS